MSLDANPSFMTKPGTVTISPDGSVYFEGFEGENCSCRDTAVLAAAWAIGVLQREVTKDIERPGGGNTAVD
jgi:hypothetical protein